MSKSIECSIKNYKTLKRQLQQMQETPKKVINSTLSDFRKKAPGWVTKEVSTHYVMSQKDFKKRSNMRVRGRTVDEIRLQYRGKALSPAVFYMSHREPKAAYTLKTRIIRDEKLEVLGKVKKLTVKQKRALAKNFRGEGTQKSKQSPVMLR